MADAPAMPNSYVGRASDFYTNRLGPRIDPAVTLVADGLHRGVKRAADTFYAARDRVLHDYVETRRSTEDGLIIKRFKRLPIDPEMATSKAKLTNTLPVDHLKALSNDPFCWTNNILAHLGADKHELVTRFIKEFTHDIQNVNFIRFPDVHHVIDPLQLPASVVASLQTSGKSERVSIVLHNHMMLKFRHNDVELFIDSGSALLEKFVNFELCHLHTYYNGGRIPLYKEHGLKPYGPLKFPYTHHNADPCVERMRLLGHIKFLLFILSQRDAFNQMFPAETFAGIIADLDAIRKDQPPPSYVDWPGKHQRIPGAWPEDDTQVLLFENVAMRDYKPERLWDTWHPSPGKNVGLADYNTPLRNAMKKNKIFYDKKGYAQARRPALRQANAAAATKNARFIDGHVAFYVPSQQEPPKRRQVPKTPKAKAKAAKFTASAPAVTPARQVINQPTETWTQQQAREAEESLTPRPVVVKKYPRTYKDIDDFFAKEDQSAWGRPQELTISQEKEDETEVRKQLIEEAAFRSEREAEAEEKRRVEEERKKAEEKRRVEEEARRKAEEERRRAKEELRIAEERRIREEDERLAQAGQLRQPHQPIVPAISTQWVDKVTATLRARSNVELAKTPEGIDLTRKDFETVVPQNQWLNDEVVNGTLMHLGNYVNQKVGIKNTRLQTPKCQVFNSFVGKGLVEGRPMTERAMRKAGVRKDNFLDVETILIPVCRGAHWTLIVIRPGHREIFHLDSLNGSGDTSLKNKALQWIRGILGDAFIESEWTLKTVASPHQSNFDDCGAHTITNGICMGLGIDPSAYTSADIPKQRLHFAAVLLNEGFKGDLTLDGI